MQHPILFVADNHYGTHGGHALYDCIRGDFDITFVEDDWRCFTDGRLASYTLMILNLISGSGNVAPPDPAAEQPLRDWVASGKPILLLHGASAAFWQWDWWRTIVGFRWVRGNDPDGFEKSVHPRQAYRVQVCKTRHPLAGRLQPVSIPADELYVELEQTAPTMTLMETRTALGTFPMCYETRTPWNGRIAGYLPGHAPDVVRIPENVENCRTLISALLDPDSPA